MVFPRDFCDDFKVRCRSVKGNVRNMFNVAGTFVLRAEIFQRALKEEHCTALHENEAEQ